MPKKDKIIFYTNERIASAMAGPAIRCWELSSHLANKYEVYLVSTRSAEISSINFHTMLINKKNRDSIFKDSKAVIIQEIDDTVLYMKKKYDFDIIYDAYDPVLFETLEVSRSVDEKKAALLSELSQATINKNLVYADKLICASNRQLDLWIGQLCALGKINIETYKDDNDLSKVLAIVSFGISKSQPKKNSQGLRDKFGLSTKDKVIVWGGGIWDWFDPLTLIKAMKIVVKNSPDVKLVFMGIKRPSEDIEMTMANSAVELAKQTGLYEKNIFFNFGWVDYEDRQNYLCDSDIGISVHFDKIETRFSFRTRVLDYLWADLPIISTEGDYFSEEIFKHKLGLVVKYNDEESVASAIEKLCHSKNNDIKKRIADYKKMYTWQRQSILLADIIESNKKLAKISQSELKKTINIHSRLRNKILKYENNKLVYFKTVSKNKILKIKRKVL